jgi:hypothetical protein
MGKVTDSLISVSTSTASNMGTTSVLPECIKILQNNSFPVLRRTGRAVALANDGDERRSPRRAGWGSRATCAGASRGAGTWDAFDTAV